MREVRDAYKILVGRPEGRRPLGRSRRRWEDNIKLDLREIGFGVWGLGFGVLKPEWWALPLVQEEKY
jgi:hypothetical protein